MRVPSVDAGRRKAIELPAIYVYRRAAVNYVKLADGDEVVVQPGETHEVNGAPMVEILSGLVDGDKVVSP